MSDLRPTTPHDRRGLTAVVRRTMVLAGGVTSFEHITRVKAPALSKYISPDDDVHMPIDVVFDLIKDTGSIAILSHMLVELGYQAVPLKLEVKSSVLPDINDVADLVQGLGRLIPAIADAVSDGVITHNEARPIAAVIENLIQQLLGLLRQVLSVATSNDEAQA